MEVNADLTGTGNLIEIRPASTAIDRVEEEPDEDADEQAVIENVIESGIAQPTSGTNSVQVFSKAHSRNEKVQQQPAKKQLILNPTINQQIRNRINFKKRGEIAEQVWPPVKKFAPVNKHEARRDVQNNNLIIHKDYYDHHRVAQYDDCQKSKKKYLGGEFSKTAHQLDNSRPVDWTKSAKDRKMQAVQQASLKRTTLRNTGDRYMGESNQFRHYLGDQEDLPRLSILENHKQIMRIMTNSYMKGIEQQHKYRNADAKDDDFQKFKEEERNTQKMSTILRSLNAPIVKRKAIAAKKMEQEYKMSRKLDSRDKARPEFEYTKGTVRESVVEEDEDKEDESVQAVEQAE